MGRPGEINCSACCSAQAGAYDGSMLMPPRFLFIDVNLACNLRCAHCFFWKRDEATERYLTLPQRVELIEEYARLSPQGRLVICGGEPMLALDTYFGVAQAARAQGLRCLSVVNGTRIRSAEMAKRMILEGPHEISISLNSHDPALHDKTRGVVGSHAKAVRALRLLIAARDKWGTPDTKIIVMGLVFGSNHTMIEAFYDFVLNDVGADKLKLNFIQPSFGQAGEVDDFYAAEGNVDPDVLLAQLKSSDARFGLGLSPVWMEQVGMYFRSLRAREDRGRGWGMKAGTDEHICNSHDRNIMVDNFGMARLCFSSQFPGKVWQKTGDLAALWTGSDDVRERMRRCNQVCGISHSVRREASTIAGNDFRLDFEKASAQSWAPV